VQHQFAGWPCAGGEGDWAWPGVVHQGGEALLQAQATGVVAGQIEQVAHERAHALGLLLDQQQGGGLGAAVQQTLGMVGDQGDRCAPFMVAERDSAQSQQGPAPDE
jgi:hypothetical protein